MLKKSVEKNIGVVMCLEVIFLFLLASYSYAKNMMFFGADPFPVVGGDGRMYVYPTTTLGSSYLEPGNWRVYSSVNLADWTDHGIIFNYSEYVNGSGPYCTAPWTESKLLWAPTACYKNGKYYFYYYINNCFDYIKKPADVSPFWAQCNGVAVSSNGGGPYTNVTTEGPLDLPLDFFHDPDFFTDPVNGTQYLYAGNGPDGRYVTIGDDMVTTSEIRFMKIDKTNVGHEANSFFYRKGHYYMVSSGGDIPYHMSSSPTGPWKYKSVIMYLDQGPGEVQAHGGSNHTSCIEYKDAWLMFYHIHNENWYGLRWVGAEYMHFNEDGTIQLMKRTREGVYYGGSGNGTTVNNITTGTGQKQFNYVGSGWKLGTEETGSWNNDLHSSSTAGDYFELDFTGIQARLYGKKAKNYGTALVSIDGGPERRISFKDDSTQNQALIYESPWLKSGTHTLKVKVQKGKINSDFVEILTSKPKPEPPRPSVRNVAIVKFDSDGPAKMKDNDVQVTASSEHHAGEPHAFDTPAFKACDWTPTTKWTSKSGGRQWISVDLGSSYTINRIVLKWDAAFARSYQIQTSDDGTKWKDVYSTTKGDGGVDDITIDETTSRYWRMYATEQGSGNGYSLWDFEIWTSGDTAVVSGGMQDNSSSENKSLSVIQPRFDRSMHDTSDSNENG